MHKIKVAEFISRLEFGGAESVILNYISHFQHPEKFDFHIITQDINDSACIRQFQDAGFTVHVVTHKRKSLLKNVQEIFRILKEEKFDVVHSHMTMTNFYVLYLAKLCGCNARISHSHCQYLSNTRKFLYPPLRFLNRQIANVWLACGYDAGVFLYGEKAMKQGKVLILKNAIDLEGFHFNPVLREKIRNIYNIGSNVCFGHVGRFVEPKNHIFLLRIFQKALEKNKDIVLLLVGDGELRSQIAAYAIQLGIENNIRFTGNITNVKELYQAMDVFVLPSLFEGLPLVTVEAQAAGIPLLVSDRVDHQCAITHDVQFMSLDMPPEAWADRLLALAKHPHHARNDAALIAAGYSICAEAQKLEKIYSV